MKPTNGPDELARYLFWIGRMHLSATATRAGTAIAPLFFIDGRFTGYPATISPRWLQLRGVGGWKQAMLVPEPSARPAHASRALQELARNHVVELLRRPSKTQPATYRLELDTMKWAWPNPAVYDQTGIDWYTMTHPREAWSGDMGILNVLKPLLALSPIEKFEWYPDNPRLAHWLDVTEYMARTYGLNVVREAVAGVMAEPEALAPFIPRVWERHFIGFVMRGRRALAQTGGYMPEAQS